MNKKGQSLWEVVLLLALVCGIFVWMDFKKTTEANQFHDQSKQSNLADHCTGLINIGCGSKEAGNKTIPTSSTGVPISPIVPIAPIVTEPTVPTLEDTFGVSKETIASIGHLNWLEKIGASIVIVLFVTVVGGLFDAIGGWHILCFRRFLMPFLLGMGISTLTYIFHPVWYSWLVGLAVLPMMGTLCLGYAGGDNFDRGLWLFIQGAVGGLFLTLISLFFHTHLLFWGFYIVYAILSGVWGGIYKNWEQFFGDWVTGSLAICSLIFWVFLTLQFSL